MNKLQTTVFWILSSLIILSCSSGKKSFEQGNYYESVLQSVMQIHLAQCRGAKLNGDLLCEMTAALVALRRANYGAG